MVDPRNSKTTSAQISLIDNAYPETKLDPKILPIWPPQDWFAADLLCVPGRRPRQPLTCPLWVKGRQAVRERGKSASPHSEDECWGESQGQKQNFAWLEWKGS